jgi:predicted outer membrane repeat protein
MQSGASTIQIEQQAISILNCIFRHNSNDFAGVIDFSKMNQSIASIRHSSFIHNVVTGTGASIGGAALSGTPQSLEVEISKFIGNQATNSNGGAVCLPSISSITIRECEFACNSAGEQGGAIFVKQNPTTDRPITIEQSTFRSNYAMKQGGSMALALAAPTGVVSVVRNNTFDWNWSDGNGGAVFCVAEEPNAALSLADNQFELNVAGGYANSSSHQGAVFFTESCLCRQAATGLPIIPNPSGDVIAIEEGDTDRLCPTVSSRAPSPDLKIFLPLSRCVVDPPPTGGPSVGGIMIPSVGTIEGIMIGVILFELLLLFVLLLVICHRRRKQKLEKQYVPTQPVIATTVSTPQIAEESSSSSQSSSSTEDSGEIGTPLGVVPDSAPTPLVSAAVQKRFREVRSSPHPHFRIKRAEHNICCLIVR